MKQLLGLRRSTVHSLRKGKKYVSPGMLTAATAMQLTGQDLDKAACGCFPFTLELVPRPLWNSETEVVWVQKPEY
eukprot:4205326-Pyramimonas_sp.AAC.1